MLKTQDKISYKVTQSSVSFLVAIDLPIRVLLQCVHKVLYLYAFELIYYKSIHRKLVENRFKEHMNKFILAYLSAV